jgi:hypothetical protein
MDADVSGLVPPAYAGVHLLAVPCTPEAGRTPLDALARAWFAGAAWVTRPTAPPRSPRPAVGARFRGIVPAAEARPGELRLADGASAVGPFPLTPAQAEALHVARAAEAFALLVDDPAPRGAPAPVPDDRDGLARAFAAGLPQGVELQVLGWAVAAARRVGGAVVADGRTVLSPDPASGVDLTLYSDDVLTPADAVGVLRAVVPGARVVRGDAAGEGPAGFVAAGDTPYDGAVRLGVRRVAEVPIALADLDRTEYGSYAYHLTWRPQDPYELEVERPSGVHAIARARVRVLVARLAAMLQGRLAGALVDDGGFVVRDRDLDERLTPAAVPTPSSWV